MSEKAKGGFAFVFFIFLILFIVLAFYDYFTTPQFKILPFFVAIMFFVYNLVMNLGEFLGVVVPALAKKNFITRGGLIGVYQRHEDAHSGMVVYFVSTYTRYLYHCNYFKWGEQTWVQRLFTMLTPTRMIRIPDYKYMFESVPDYASDTQEGAIFYHGTLRGASIISFEEALKIRLVNSLKFISEIYTEMQSAKAAAEAAAAGKNQQIVDVSTQLSTAMENISKWQKNQPPLLLSTQQMPQRREE